MKRLVAAGAWALAFVMVGVVTIGAQPRMGGPMHMGSQSGQQEQQEPQSPQQPMMGHGMMRQGMMGHGMMGHGMACPMMAMIMDPMGTGMMGGRQMDAKTTAQLLQLRGDMLKAMGDVLLKHSKVFEEAK